MTKTIFISYARKDAKDLALQLRNDLSAIGYSVWLDLNEISMGGNFTADIERAIDTCDLMLVIISAGSTASPWCRAEQLRALRKGKRIIPLRAQSDTESPLHLEHLNQIDFADNTRYPAMFRDLLSDITSGHAFRQETAPSKASTSVFKKVSVAPNERTYTAEKRNAGVFRRHLRTLRGQEWLGGRFWWAYFLFSFTDAHSLVDILEAGELTAPYIRQQKRSSKWDRYVRFKFRPRNPSFFWSEGFWAINDSNRPNAPIQMPIYLLFDMEALLLHPDSRFSDGDPTKLDRTYNTPAPFGELPFEMIYHDGWWRKEERDEITRYREAEVLLPDRVGLEALQFIWTRSDAEYETLYHLLNARNPYLWKQWRDKITPRNDFVLFNHQRPYIQKCHLSEQQVRLVFNPCQDRAYPPFMVQVMVQYANGEEYQWEHSDYQTNRDLVLNIPTHGHYEVSVLLDGELAYNGLYQGVLTLL